MIGFFSVVLGGLTIVVVVILYKNQSAEIKSFFLPGLILKLLSGITLGLVYTYYYPVGDTFGFFSDAQVLVDLARSNPGEYLNFLWQGDGSEAWASSLINSQIRSLFLVKVLSLITMFSFGNYWVASLYFSLISFVASWYVIRKLILHFPKGKWAAVVAFLFVPSFVFWSSGIVKESMAMAALMFLSGFYIASLRKDKLAIWEWITALIALIFLWNLKYYWAAIFVPAVLATLIYVRWLLPRIPKLRIGFEYILWLAVFCSVMLLASNIHPNFYLSRFLEVIVENHDAYVGVSDENPFIHFTNLSPTWSSILINSPWAFISGLFRPFIFESQTVFQAVISLENLLLIVLCFINLKNISTAWHSPHRLMILSAVVYISLLSIFLALSTPNFGTLSRYRIGFLPFLFFLLLYYPSQDIKRWINKLKQP